VSAAPVGPAPDLFGGRRIEGDRTAADFVEAYAVFMRRDVTEMLAVDDCPDAVNDTTVAIVLIAQRRRVAVRDDVTAIEVLQRLGCSPAEAADQVRASYGPAVVSFPPEYE